MNPLHPSTSFPWKLVTAFDEYRSETLRRLEEEQRAFVEFLDRLRRARDQAEFDQFMAERQRRGQDPEQPVTN